MAADGLGIALGAAMFGYAGSVEGRLGFHNAPGAGLLYVAMGFLMGRMQAGPVGRRVNLAVGWLIAALICLNGFPGCPLASLGMMQGPLVGYGMAVWR